MTISDEDIRLAKVAWLEQSQNKSFIKEIFYEKVDEKFTLTLSNGTVFQFSPDLIPQLEDASVFQLCDVHLGGDGRSLHWESLDVDYSIQGLVSKLLEQE